MSTLTRSTERIEASILKECDEGESFCSILEGMLEEKAHWKRNGYGLDLHNSISDLISETRGAIEKARNSATQDAHDTAGDHKRDAA